MFVVRVCRSMCLLHVFVNHLWGSDNTVSKVLSRAGRIDRESVCSQTCDRRFEMGYEFSANKHWSSLCFYDIIRGQKGRDEVRI